MARRKKVSVTNHVALSAQDFGRLCSDRLDKIQPQLIELRGIMKEYGWRLNISTTMDGQFDFSCTLIKKT